jgi:hypothetical protein
MNPESFHNKTTPALDKPVTEDGYAANESDYTVGAPKEAAPRQWNPEQETLAYDQENRRIVETLSNIEDQLQNLYQTEAGTDLDETVLNALLTEREALLGERITASANYPGDWTGLLYERMTDPHTKELFISQRTLAMQSMLSGIPNTFENKPQQYQQHYQNQIDTYDERVASIFNHTNVGLASEYNKNPRNLGQNKLGQPGVVFTDATHQGILLTARQKNITEAHEKGHGFRDFTSSYDRQEIKAAIDTQALETLTTQRRREEQSGKSEGRFSSMYVEKPEEIIERMAQFKNYFKMGATDKFTKEHLEHIREHYVADTRLDNGVTDLLFCVTPKTEATFLKLINTYPI